MLAVGNSRASLMGIWVLLMVTLSYHYMLYSRCIYILYLHLYFFWYLHSNLFWGIWVLPMVTMSYHYMLYNRCINIWICIHICIHIDQKLSHSRLNLRAFVVNFDILWKLVFVKDLTNSMPCQMQGPLRVLCLLHYYLHLYLHLYICICIFCMYIYLCI